MNERLQRLFEWPGLAFPQLGDFVQSLMAFFAAWLTGQEDTTSIAWEDGEVSEETHR